MITNEERLALVLEANDKATATLQRVRKEIEATGASANRGRKGTSDLNQEVDKLSDGKIVKSARAMSSIAYAADQAKLGTREAARAMGELGETIALASGNAKFAAWAIGINAAIIGMVTFIGLLRDSAEQTKPTDQFIRRLSHMTKDQADAERAGLKAARDSLIDQTANDAGSGWLNRFQKMMASNLATQKGRALARQGGVDFELLDHTNANFEEFQKKTIVELNTAERNRVLALHDQTTEMVRQKDTELALGDIRLRSIRHQASSVELQRAEAAAALKNANQQTETMFRFRDANGHIHQLTTIELSMRGSLLERNRQIFKETNEQADAKYKEQVADTKYSQEQTIWYATRRLTQSDYQTSLDDSLHSFTDQLYALQRSGKASGEITAESERLLRIYELQKEKLEQLHEIQTRKLRAQNNIDAASGGLFGPGDAMEQHQARLDAIEEERRAAIKAGEDVIEVNRRAENARNKEQRRMVEQAKSDYKTIEDVLIASKSRQIKAIGHAAQTMRRVELGVEASVAAVRALRATGEGLFHLGTGDFAGAASFFASALQFGAAAALAGQESLGGGGGGGGGGGSSAVSSAGTFEPRSGGQANGGFTLNLYARDQFGRDNIKQTLFFLQRAGVLKVAGAEITPTSGLSARGS